MRMDGTDRFSSAARRPRANCRSTSARRADTFRNRSARAWSSSRPCPAVPYPATATGGHCRAAPRRAAPTLLLGGAAPGPSPAEPLPYSLVDTLLRPSLLGELPSEGESTSLHGLDGHDALSRGLRATAGPTAAAAVVGGLRAAGPGARPVPAPASYFTSWGSAITAISIAAQLCELGRRAPRCGRAANELSGPSPWDLPAAWSAGKTEPAVWWLLAVALLAGCPAPPRRDVRSCFMSPRAQRSTAPPLGLGGCKDQGEVAPHASSCRGHGEQGTWLMGCTAHILTCQP